MSTLRALVEECRCQLGEKKPKLGSGKRFASLVKQLKQREDVETEDAVADATLAKLAKKHGPESNPMKKASVSALDKLKKKYGNEAREIEAALNSIIEYHVRDPKALAAAIGRKKYGAKRFAKMAAAGRRKHAKK